VLRQRARSLRRDSGFTLIEMLTAMVVLGFMFAAVSVVLSSMVRHSDEVEDRSVLQADVRFTIDRLSIDLRQAYSGVDGVSPIESISPTGLTFLSPDRATPFHLRRISYRLNSGKIERAMATSTDTDGAPWNIPSLGAWVKQVDSVTNAAPFTYYDSAGAVTSVPADVSTVKVDLDLVTNSSPTRQLRYSTSVTVRSDVETS
jgi:prepilin-type N-terminal cleavage/methylation domain-containing protein